MKKENPLGDVFKKTELTDLGGIKLEKKALKNKVVIISYFQTWCSDCVKEQPELLKLKEKFGNQLEVLMISDEPTDLMIRFKDKFQSNLNFYHSSTHLKPDLGVKKYPTTYLYDKNGKVLESKIEGIYWYTPEIIAMIEQALAH